MARVVRRALLGGALGAVLAAELRDAHRVAREDDPVQREGRPCTDCARHVIHRVPRDYSAGFSISARYTIIAVTVRR